MGKLIAFDPATLRARREAAKLTEAELAEAAGVSESAISRIERGERDPRYGTIVAIETALAKRKKSRTRQKVA